MHRKKLRSKLKQYLTFSLIALLLFGSVPMEPLLVLAQESEPVEELLQINEEDPSLLEEESNLELEADQDIDMSEGDETNPTEELVATMLELESANLEQGELSLRWLANSNQDHLALHPQSNVRQRHIMELNFSPLSDNIYSPGDIEIRLPRALFEDRNGNLITNPVPMEIPLPGDTSFDFVIDTVANEIVITNFQSVTGSDTHLRVQFAMSYLPSQSPNGYRNDDIYARATFAEDHGREAVESDRLSLDLMTRVVAQNTTKQSISPYSTWRSTWGAAPENARDYFYVRYRIFHGTTSQTTQPFVAQLVETPLDDGEIVAWTGISSSSSVASVWTRGDTASFNNQAARTWNVASPWNESRWQEIIVRYPRLGEPDQVVRNRVEVTFTPADHARDAEANPIISHEREASHTYNTVYFRYQGDLFSITKWMNSSGASELSVLETGADRSYSGQLAVTARGFSATQNGTQPFTTTLIDDYMYLRTSTGMHQLNPADYRFTQVSVSSSEIEPIRDEDGTVLYTRTVANANRSPVRLYYKTEADGWQYFRTFIPTTTTSSTAFTLPNEDIYRIKAVHDNGLYQVNLNLSFNVRLNTTPHVLSLIENQATADLVNFGSLIVEDHTGRHMNTVTEANYRGTLFQHFIDRDLETYGHLVQRATQFTRLTRVGFESPISKMIRSGGIVSQPAHARMLVPYRLIAQNNTTGNRLPNDVFEQLIPEQTEGVFYDLLPRGTVLDLTSVIARDAHGRVVTHTVVEEENWQGSGRTLVRIYVEASAGSNLRNASSIGSTIAANPLLGGTGFSVDFNVFYPWMSIGFFGANLRNIASYQSRSGALLGTHAHTNANNTNTALNVTERGFLSNFPDTGMLDPAERNTISTVRTDTVSPITSDQIGFRKMVRATGDAGYGVSTSVRPGGTYNYRLQYIGPEHDETKNLVIFDVLEAAHNGRDHWRGTFESIDVSHPESIGVDPIVYYSTQSGLNPMTNSAHADLTDEAIWKTTPPANRADITAIAVDLSTDANGRPFVFAPRTGTLVNIYMQAPHGAVAGNSAYNRAQYRITTIPLTGGDSIDWPIAQTMFTMVELLEREVTIAKTSDPSSGSSVSPTEIPEGSTVNYTIRVQNNEELALRNVVLEDLIPAHMSFDPDALRGFFGNNPASAIPLSEHTRVTSTHAGNRVEWTISTLGAGESFTLLIPATIDPDLMEETVFENTARIISIDDYEYDIDSDTTYHIVRPVQSPTLRKEANVDEAMVGAEIEYTLTVNNPNDFALNDFVVVDNLDADLVSLVQGSVQLNGEDVAYTFTLTGELRINLAELSPNGTYEITFSVVVLIEAAGQTLPNIGILEGPADEDGERPVIDEDNVDVQIDELGDLDTLTPELDPVKPDDPTLEKSADIDEVLIGAEIEYILTVNNSNEFYLNGFAVVDNLRIDLVSLVRGSVQVNGEYVVYSFDPETGELRVVLDYVNPGDTVITFNVEVLAGAAGQTIPNTGILEDEDGNIVDKTPEVGVEVESPKICEFSEWDPFASYAMGDLVIYGGRVWEAINIPWSGSGNMQWRPTLAVSQWREVDREIPAGCETIIYADGWDARAFYTAGDYVIFNGRVYRALLSHQGFGDPGWNPGVTWSNWELTNIDPSTVHPRSEAPVPPGIPEWDSRTAYAPGDRVLFNGRVWEALAATNAHGVETHNPPMVLALWRWISK